MAAIKLERVFFLILFAPFSLTFGNLQPP